MTEPTSPRTILEAYSTGALNRRDAMAKLGMDSPHQFFALLERLKIPQYLAPEAESAEMVAAAVAFLEDNENDAA